MTRLPPIAVELLDGPYPCCLTTLDGRGRPYSVVVWCGRDGDEVSVNAADGVWLANLRRDPTVSLVVLDTANILRYVAIRGRAVDITPDERYDHINSLSEVYEGGAYSYTTPEEAPRYRVTIEPERVRTLDLTGD
jgi:PPOX class probable F420-dependent enzyme